MNLNNFRGDLSDISSKNASLFVNIAVGDLDLRIMSRLVMQQVTRQFVLVLKTKSLFVTVAVGDLDSRMVSGLVMQQVTRQAADKAALFANVLLPFAFRGRWDADADVAALWTEVWSETASSEGAALLLHGPEIVASLSNELTRDEWSLRRSAAQVRCFPAVDILSHGMDLFIGCFNPINAYSRSGHYFIWDGPGYGMFQPH